LGNKVTGRVKKGESEENLKKAFWSTSTNYERSEGDVEKQKTGGVHIKRIGGGT